MAASSIQAHSQTQRPATPRPATERFLTAKIHLSSTFDLEDAEEAGVEIEHSIIKGKTSVQGVISYYTLEILLARGVRVEVLEEDAEQAAAQRIRDETQRTAKERRSLLTNDTPRNFNLGSYAGFFRLEEIYAEFARMRTMFPTLVTAPETIGTSVEGRPILAYRIGTDRAVSTTAPEVLYTALHHAREPGSAASLIYYAWWLLEQFQANTPEAAYLLNNRQLYFVPVVNPDGYAFNQASMPGGGGMWRKNRQTNRDGSFGVDLNRNYGTQEFWSAPNGGSSTNTRSDTYRGIAPFSEPETQAIRDFCQRRNFHTAINYHTFSNLLIYPFSYIDTETPDSTYFRALTAEITKDNLYSAGRDLQTVGYAVRGASDDWMYAGMTGKKIMAYTPEVGTVDDGFWPPASRIIPQCAENLSTNRMTAWSAAVNLRPVQYYVVENPQTGFTRIVVEVQNIGIQNASAQAGLTLRPLAAGMNVLRSDRQIRALRSTESVREVFDCTFDANVQNGSALPVEILITQENTPRRDTMQVQIQQATRRTLFAAATDSTQWQLGHWGIVRDALTGRTALTDSPNRNYLPGARNYVQLASPLSLRDVRAATLEFQTRWSIESNGDLGVVQVSSDNGRTWRPLRTSLMKPSTGFGGFGYDGNFPQWIRQECSLREFLGQDILLRFGLLSDGDAQFDGIYISDVAVRLYRDSITQRFVQNLSAPRLSPNAIRSGGEVRIEFPLSNDVQANVNVYNVLGQVVFSGSALPIVSDGTLVFRPSALAGGLYFVEIRTETSSVRLPLLVL
ncbi:MAG: immune inhibitor A [Candidatus Kapabacteria bacterium]|nr:immune inhibitor A [Candidatus Kapabacteria bacterium]